MKNGNGHYREFDPAGSQEVNDVLPTETGLDLEEMRQATQADLRSRVKIALQADESNDPQYEFVGGSHPYRDAEMVDQKFLGPWHSWFW